MQSIITSKFRITIPKKIRENLGLNVGDELEWRIDMGKVIVAPRQKNFLKHRNSISTGPRDIRDDIERARELRAEKHR